MSSPEEINGDGEPGRRQAQPGRTQAGGGWVPIPDPTTLTDAAIGRATEIFRREIVALRETLETRLDASDEDRSRSWERLRDLPALYETAANHLRDELIQRDAHAREVITQRLNDLDTAIKVAADHIERLPVDLAADFRNSQGAEREYIEGQIELARAATMRVSDVTLEKFAAIDGLFNSNDKALTAALAAQEKAAAEQQKSNTLAIDKSEKTTTETIRANDDKTASAIKAQADTMADLKERLVRIESTGVGVQSVTGSPYDATVLRQAEKAAAQAAAVAQAAQARAIMALGISGFLLLISLASVIFAVTKK